MIDRTEAPKISVNNKNNLWWLAVTFLELELSKISLLLALILTTPDVVKTLFCLIYTNFMIPYLYPLENWFTTNFELALVWVISSFYKAFLQFLSCSIELIIK